MNNRYYISNISYEVGSLLPINQIEGPSEDVISILESTGIKNFCKSSISLVDMANRCLKKTFGKGSFDPASFGTVLYAANNLTVRSNNIDFSYFDLMLAEFNLTNAYLHGTFLSNCSNLSSALQLGCALLSTSPLPHVLILLADKVDDDNDRLMNSSESVLSDGAISFILSREHGEFELDTLVLKNDITYFGKVYDIITYFKKNTDSLKELWGLISNGKEFQKVLLPNYSLLAQRGFKSQLKLSSEQLFMDNISRYGHVFACDVFINFVDYLSENSPSKDSFFAFFTIGNYRWGAFTLKKV